MNKKFVLDTSVYLTYASHDKLYRLLDLVKTYDLIVYVNDGMLDEVFRNASRIIRVPSVTPEKIVDAILNLSELVHVIPRFDQSPDPKDNFLFDLAIQTDSQVIVTKEKALLDFETSPIAIHDIKWFKETFPVPL